MTKEYKNPAYEVGSECNSGTREVAGAVTLRINGEELELVPFVQNLLRNVTLALVRELDGYQADARIELIIDAGREDAPAAPSLP